MKDWSTNINTYKENSTAAQKIANNVKLLTHDHQY
jgi:hypothetical protein